MSNSNRSRRSLRSQKPPSKKKESELFVQLPKFSKRLGDEKRSVKMAEDMDIDEERKQMLLTFLNQANCQRWIWYEFIDSPIDKAILASTYNWHDYVSNYFSRLETRQLPLRCWQHFRRSLGKAGRYSLAFIERERNILEEYRHIVHQLQQGKLDLLCDKQFSTQLMPMQVPMPFAPDAKVNGLLCAPNFAKLNKGRIISYDLNESKYLVKFKINGKHQAIIMPDCMLQAREEYEIVPSSIIIQEYEENQLLAASDSPEDKAKAQLVDAVLQLNKLLELKRKTVLDMASMNEEVQINGLPPLARRESKQTSLREKLQQRHASNIITLHRVNAEILEPLRLAHNFVAQYEQDVLHKKCLTRESLQENCRSLAEMDIRAATQNVGSVQANDTRTLILRMQTLLHVCGELGHGNDIEVDAAMEEIVKNMQVGLPEGMDEEFQQIVGLLKPLAEKIRIVAQTEESEMIEDVEVSDIDMDL